MPAMHNEPLYHVFNPDGSLSSASSAASPVKSPAYATIELNNLSNTADGSFVQAVLREVDALSRQNDSKSTPDAPQIVYEDYHKLKNHSNKVPIIINPSRHGRSSSRKDVSADVPLSVHSSSSDKKRSRSLDANSLLDDEMISVDQSYPFATIRRNRTPTERPAIPPPPPPSTIPQNSISKEKAATLSRNPKLSSLKNEKNGNLGHNTLSTFAHSKAANHKSSGNYDHSNHGTPNKSSTLKIAPTKQRPTTLNTNQSRTLSLTQRPLPAAPTMFPSSTSTPNHRARQQHRARSKTIDISEPPSLNSQPDIPKTPKRKSFLSLMRYLRRDKKEREPTTPPPPFSRRPVHKNESSLTMPREHCYENMGKSRDLLQQPQKPERRPKSFTFPDNCRQSLDFGEGDSFDFMPSLSEYRRSESEPLIAIDFNYIASRSQQSDINMSVFDDEECAYMEPQKCSLEPLNVSTSFNDSSLDKRNKFLSNSEGHISPKPSPTIAFTMTDEQIDNNYLSLPKESAGGAKKPKRPVRVISFKSSVGKTKMARLTSPLDNHRPYENLKPQEASQDHAVQCGSTSTIYSPALHLLDVIDAKNRHTLTVFASRKQSNEHSTLMLLSQFNKVHRTQRHADTATFEAMCCQLLADALSHDTTVWSMDSVRIRVQSGYRPQLEFVSGVGSSTTLPSAFIKHLVLFLLQVPGVTSSSNSVTPVALQRMSDSSFILKSLRKIIDSTLSDVDAMLDIVECLLYGPNPSDLSSNSLEACQNWLIQQRAFLVSNLFVSHITSEDSTVTRDVYAVSFLTRLTPIRLAEALNFLRV